MQHRYQKERLVKGQYVNQYVNQYVTRWWQLTYFWIFSLFTPKNWEDVHPFCKTRWWFQNKQYIAYESRHQESCDRQDRWFQICFIFIPIWRRFPSWLYHIFQMGTRYVKTVPFFLFIYCFFGTHFGGGFVKNEAKMLPVIWAGISLKIMYIAAGFLFM